MYRTVPYCQCHAKHMRALTRKTLNLPTRELTIVITRTSDQYAYQCDRATQTPNYELQTPNYEHQTPNSKRRTTEPAAKSDQTINSGRQTRDAKHGTRNVES
jgi:hypothetical protein